MKAPSPPWFLSLAAALAAGIVLGRFAFPRNAPVGSGAGPSTDPRSASAPGTADPSLSGLPLPPEATKAFAGTVGDLLKEVTKAGDWSAAQMRVTLLLAGTPAETIARLIEDYAWRPNPEWKENVVFGALVRRWAETDPAAALAWGDGQDKSIRQRVHGPVLEVWARSSPDEALVYARRIRDRQERAYALSMIATAVARDDPRAALRILGGGQNGTDTSGYYGIFNTWASNDPAAAHAAALGLADQNQRNAAMGAVMSAWAQTDPEAATEAALAISNVALRNQSLENVLGTWAATDPEAALSVAQSLTDARARRNSINNILQNWAQQDPVAASAVFDSLPSRDREQVAYQLAGSWAEKDPRAALAWAQSLTGNAGQNALASVIQKWAASDGPAAVAALDALPSRLRAGQLENVAAQWATYDRDAALLWATSLERPKDQAKALGACLSGLDLNDSGQIDAILGGLPAGSARSDLIATIASNHAWNDPEGTMEWLRALPAADFDKAMKSSGVLQSLAESSPRTAADLLGQLSSSSVDQWVWSTTAQNFARDDPAAALAWAQSIEIPGNRQSALQSVLNAWAEEDPAGAMEQAHTLPEGSARRNAIDGVLSTWADRNPEGLLAWAETARGEDRENALLRSSIQLASDNPAASAEVVAALVLQHGDPTKLSGALENAVAQVASTWVSEDIGKACEWAATLPAGAAQERAIESIAASWTTLDAVAASEWIQRLPQGNARDGAVSSLVNGISQSDPESAFAWATSIGDVSERESHIQNAVGTWRNIDPAAARAAVEGANLSDTLRQSLLRDLDADAD